MKKEKFKKELKNALDILTEEAKEEEVRKYVSIWEEKEQNGKTEEEIEKELEIESIKKEIYLSRGIDMKKVGTKKGFIYRTFEELFDTIHNVVEVMSKNTLKENLKIVLDILILIVIVCVIKIPFILIENMGDSLFDSISSPIVTNIWGLAIDFVYIIVAIMVFMNIFTKWFKNLKKPKEEKKVNELPKVKMEGNELEGISLTNNEEEKK